MQAVAEPGNAQCLVVGTEDGQLLVLSPSNLAIVAKAAIPSAPAFISVSGIFDEEYRIVAAARNGCVYTIKKSVLSL